MRHFKDINKSIDGGRRFSKVSTHEPTTMDQLIASRKLKDILPKKSIKEIVEMTDARTEEKENAADRNIRYGNDPASKKVEEMAAEENLRLIRQLAEAIELVGSLESTELAGEIYAMADCLADFRSAQKELNNHLGR